MRLLATALLGLGFLTTPCLAAIVDVYAYPFVNPFEATVIGTPSIYAAKLPEQVPVSERQLLVFPDRKVPDIFWYTARFHYSLARQPRRAPLAFIIPGTGANFNSSKTIILMKTLYKAGLHVVSLASPIHPNFIVSASSSGRPGLLQPDAVDLYRVMELIRRQIGNEIDISGYDLAGYSLGATEAAFVAKLDDERKSFNFNKVLLINPPVNLYHSAERLDAMFEHYIHSPADFNRLFNNMMTIFSSVYQPEQEVRFNEDFLYEVYKRNPPKESTLEALIGIAFRFTSINLLFVSDVMTNSGFIVPKDVELSVTDSLTLYFKAASRLDFADYAHAILYPFYTEGSPNTSFEQLVEMTSLREIGSFLRNSKKIWLMHNEDDVTLAEGDIEYLESIFGDRAQIYPKGGHCGNMAYTDNVAYVIDFFSN